MFLALLAMRPSMQSPQDQANRQSPIFIAGNVLAVTPLMYCQVHQADRHPVTSLLMQAGTACDLVV